MSKEDIESIIKCEPGSIECVLRLVQLQVTLLIHTFVHADLILFEESAVICLVEACIQ